MFAGTKNSADVFVVIIDLMVVFLSKSSRAVGGSDTGLFSSEWYERSRSHIHQLVSLTLDNLLHVQLELSFDENNRLSVALVNWLSAMLFQCPALLSLSSLRDTVVAGLITIAAQTNNIGDSPLKDPSSRTSLTASQVLGKFVQSEEPDEVPLIHLSLPKSVTGSRLIRNIASQALYNHINSFAGLSSHVIDEKQLQKRLRTILGYLNVMDVEGLSILTYRRESFHRLCTSLAELLRFSTNSVELLHDCSPQISSSQSVSGRTNATRPVSLFPKSFELFHDSKTLELVQLVACRIAAQETVFYGGSFCWLVAAVSRSVQTNRSANVYVVHILLIPTFEASSLALVRCVIFRLTLYSPELIRLRSKDSVFMRSAKTKKISIFSLDVCSMKDALDMFVDTCRDVMTLTGEIHRNPCLLLITAGLFGYLQNDMVVWEQRNADCLRIVTEWFDSDLLHLPISIAQCTKSTEQSNVKHVTVWPELPSASAMTSSDTCTREHVAAKDEKPSLKELKQNTITVCLLLELFSTASLIYVSKPANNEDLLRIGLVACTSFAAHPDLVGKTARCCLQQLAINCGYADVHSMITANADFLVSTITLQLHRIILLSPDDAQRAVPPELLTELRSTCHTLETLFEYATMDVLPLLRPLVKQILTCLDLTYEHHADLFLPAFKCLVSTCRWWNEKHYKASPLHFDSSSLALDEAQPPISEPADVMSDIFSLTLRNTRALIEETRRIHNICGPSVSPGGDESTLVSSDTSSLTKLKEEQEEDCARIFPDHLHIVEEVMLRCVHLLAQAQPKLRMLSMDVLMEGYITLADETELLLPLVHKAWASLMARFRDQHAVVVEKAFQLLTVLTKVAGDFIRARASSDILPPLLNFLTRGASVSAGADESFQHLTAYRVQRQLLLQMGSLCVQLGLMSESLRSVMRMLILYLEDDQPQGLQQAAEHSLTRLWRIDPGLIWTCILAEVPRDLQNEVFGQIPSEKFQTCETLRAQEEPLELFRTAMSEYTEVHVFGEAYCTKAAPFHTLFGGGLRKFFSSCVLETISSPQLARQRTLNAQAMVPGYTMSVVFHAHNLHNSSDMLSTKTIFVNLTTEFSTRFPNKLNMPSPPRLRLTNFEKPNSSMLSVSLNRGLSVEIKRPIILDQMWVPTTAWKLYNLTVEYFDVFRKAQLSDAQNHKPEIVDS
ncbi:TEL2-interacting protein 1 homolog [Clonorchis sinensis]|uniref:TEL2-interacting protein 1 homolog n=1 Tax=Clonorchis sinensis TaxID=79923 RepID=G7YMY6_CLOSI|nr:TEL2-interacting protein 1 homolog [Clonorchis sinensis]